MNKNKLVEGVGEKIDRGGIWKLEGGNGDKGKVGVTGECVVPVRPIYFCKIRFCDIKVSKGVNIRNRYNQVPHLTQDTNGKVTNSQLDTTNESQEVSPFPAGDHKAHINRRMQRHSKHKREET